MTTDTGKTREYNLSAEKPRIDGTLKLTGGADYAADRNLPNQTYGYPVTSTITKGRLVSLELDDALAMPGVLDIFHHDNFDQLSRSPNSFAEENLTSEPRLPFEDNEIHYQGQYIALVVADTFNHARAAALKVKANYERDDDFLTDIKSLDSGEGDLPGEEQPGDASSLGDADSALKGAAVTVDQRYSIAQESHSVMEMHTSVAQWENDMLTIYESSQGVVFQRNALSKIFGIPPEKVTVISHFIGSGFGGKLFMWPHAIMTAVAARRLGRPVKTVLSRQQEYLATGYRPTSLQRVRLGADESGKLLSIHHDGCNESSPAGKHDDTVSGATPKMYDCGGNVAVTNRLVDVNKCPPCPMRAPGESSGNFALETALDELAVKLDMDPLALRKKNFADADPASGLPWSSNHLQECWDNAASRFGWDKRNATPGAMKDGDEIIGYGMATQSWEAMRQHCSARVGFRADGSLMVACGTQDIGTGTYTIVAQTASELTGIPIEMIDVRLGDSSLPSGPLSGGSFATSTVLPAVSAATREALSQLKTLATAEGGVFENVDADSIELENARLVSGDKSVEITQLLKDNQLGLIDGEASARPGDEQEQYSFRSFGAVFVEVRWDAGISRLRVSRVVSTVDIGRAINPMTARNQVEGGIVMGMGMGLFEQSEFDHSGYPYNNNLADYIVPVNADMPHIDVELLDYPDYLHNEFGARGVGEIGLTGIAAAISNAVYNATGKRLRDLPISIEKMLAP
ncbi:xanthine dehydrogenase family protein molybdopterin-binding subunit [Kushneria phyllosphaerae]|uniref:Xanthine dehydrogenase YagR molybdenum-binding subunit n=1 Tax=Kushneria phyllosphaerae TaxID=2100822 RepID=A0A2R8CJS6_9GAMM|nr:xanthine dehydrogenase family protein molybdopterin-binding subunit [Kushneria phyllosphaerae]SPJ33014.1 Putative xanthine dehydrogenase YagR molybdenum-binding subunit [Kushneria phyllosphaerae]